jgi:hypothetical protein
MIKLLIFLNEKKEVEVANIVQLYNDFQLSIDKVELDKIEDIFNELPIEKMNADNAYYINIQPRYEYNGAGCQFLEGYDIKDIDCCTKVQ